MIVRYRPRVALVMTGWSESTRIIASWSPDGWRAVLLISFTALVLITGLAGRWMTEIAPGRLTIWK